MEQFISKLPYKSERLNVMGNKNKEAKQQRSPGTTNFTEFQENNLGVLLQSSCNYLLREIVAKVQ